MAHVICGMVVACAAYGWPAAVVYALPAGIIFAIFGFPYLFLEIPVAMALFALLDRGKMSWVRGVATAASAVACGYVGYWIAPLCGGERLYAAGYAIAGATFGIMMAVTAICTAGDRMAASSISGAGMTNCDDRRDGLST